MQMKLVALALALSLAREPVAEAAGEASWLAMANDAVEDPLCAEASCPAQAGSAKGGAFSMLQHTGREARRHGLDDVLPTVEHFKDAKLIYAELPISPLAEASSALGGLLGDALPPLMGGPSLDLSSTARLTVAHFPDAKIGWDKTPGRSRRQDLPHHFMSIQLPLTLHGERMYSTVYSLVDDDAVMLLRRMGIGIPAKVATFDLPSGVSTNASIAVNRRGVSVLHCQVADGGEISPDAEELRRVHDRKDVTRLGTHLENLNSLWMTRSMKTEIKTARRAYLHHVAWTGDIHEPVGMLLLPVLKARAWLLTANLEVTSKVSGTPVKMPSPNLHALMLRTGGAIIHPLVRASPLHWEQYQNGKLLWLEQRVNPDAVAKVLPPNFELDDPLALVYNVYWNPTTIYGVGIKTFSDPFVYNELWVVLRVRYKGRPFNYPVLMLLDDDVAMMSGQDIIGCPKKLADFTYTASNTPSSPVYLNIKRRGRHVLTINGTVGKKTSEAVRGLNDRVRNSYAWVFSHEFPWEPQYQSPSYIFLRSLMTPRMQHTIEVSDLDISWGSSAQEPLGEWFVSGPPANAGLMHVDQAWLPAINPLPHVDLAKLKLEYPPDLFLKQPMKMLYLEHMKRAEYTDWWLRTYQLNYM